MSNYDGYPITNVGTNMPTSISGDGANPEELAMIDKLWSVWSEKYVNNRTRQYYYDAKNAPINVGLAFKDASIANRIKPVCGWAKKAVDMLAERSRFDYFAFPDDGALPELREAYEANDMKNQYREATTSELIQSCAAYTVTAGDTKAGEPAVVVNTYSALNCAMVWDRRHKRIAYGMTITNVDDNGNPTGINVFTDSSVLELTYVKGGWSSNRTEHSMGRTLMEPLCYCPSLERPFGYSRISRSVMSIIDNAVREVLRTEVSSEVYSVPQRFFLNVDMSQLNEKNFKTYWNGYFLANGDPDTGNPASAGQFNPPGINDHILYMKQLASQFAGETGLPVSSLGVISDNPSSAEAMNMSLNDLIHTADYLNDCNGAHMMNVARLIVATAKNKSFEDARAALEGVTPIFHRTDMPSVVSMSDAALKQAQAIPELAKTKMFLRMLGYSESDITQVWNQLQRANATDLLNQLAATSQATTTTATNQEQTDQTASTDTSQETDNAAITS